MREDMLKIIVERPRGGRSWARPFKLRREKDMGRKHAGLKRSVLQQNGHTKYLNENLAPLRRYLHKQKGRNWDDVFSEICARLDTGSTVKMHVREHIEDFIMLRVSFDKGGQWLGVNRRWHQPTSVDKWWTDLYVDPHDNTIKETACLRKKLGIEKFKYQWPQYDKPLPNCIRPRDKTSGLVKLNMCWFSYVLDKNPDLTDDELYIDIKIGAWRNHLKWSVIEQKQLSKKQLAKHDLKNGVDNEK